MASHPLALTLHDLTVPDFFNVPKFSNFFK